MEITKGDYKISTDKALLSIDVIHDYLANKAYWARGRSLEQVKISLEHSICFGVYHNKLQVGFARVITDYATQYILADVFILEEYRGKGLAKWLVNTIVNHEALNNLQGMLLTNDAHGLYEQYGFANSKDYDGKFMTKKPK